MNKAEEFHNLADNAKNCNEEIQKILSACRKNASFGYYNCCFSKTRLDGGKLEIITDRLSEMGFRIVIPYDSDFWEVHW